MSNNSGYSSTWKRGSGWGTTQRSRGSASRGSRAGRLDPSWRQKSRELPIEYPPQPLGPLMTIISNLELEEGIGSKAPVAQIVGCEYVASYSWLDKKIPTILVPGKPPAWTPLREPQKLKEDSGDFFRDPNAARYPKYSIEPSVRAIFTQLPDFPTASVDLFACGSTIGNLLRFVRGIDKPFRFHVEVVGNTVFLVRKEKSPVELIPDVRGYGHTFPESYTTWEADVKGSESHQRIVRYTFGKVKCLIRFESDGYDRDLVPPYEQSKVPGFQGPTIEPDIASFMEATNISSLTQTTDTSLNRLETKRGGKPLPQQAIFDLKTRASWKGEIDMSEILPRLWVSQIPNFVIGYHSSGVFADIRKQDVRQDLKRWEAENKEALARLHALMQKIIDYAKGTSSGKLEIYRTKIDLLEVRKQAGDDCDVLPPGLRSRWMQGKSGDDDYDDDNDDATAITAGSYSDHGNEEANGEGNGEGKRGFISLDRSIDDAWGDDKDSEPDYTACGQDCGYCGRCDY